MRNTDEKFVAAFELLARIFEDPNARRDPDMCELAATLARDAAELARGRLPNTPHTNDLN